MNPGEARLLLRDIMEFHEQRDPDQTLRELTVTLQGMPKPLLRVWSTPHGSVRVESQRPPDMGPPDWPSLGAPEHSIEAWDIGAVWRKNAQRLLQEHGMGPDEARSMLLKLHREDGVETPALLYHQLLNTAKSMLSPSALQLARQEPERVSIHHHNICLIGPHGMREVLRHNPGAWEWAVRHVKPQEDLKSPQDLLALVRDSMARSGVDAQNLEYAARIQRSVIKSLRNHPNSAGIINTMASALRDWEQGPREQPERMAAAIGTALSTLGDREPIPFDLTDALIQLLNPAAHQDISHSARPANISSYRIARIGREALRELRKTNPGIITWAMRMEHPKEELRHPGQVVAIVRESFRERSVAPSCWRNLARTNPSTMKVIAQPDQSPDTTNMALCALGRLPEHPGVNTVRKAMKILRGRLMPPRTPGMELFLRLLLQECNRECARKPNPEIMSEAILARNYVECTEADGQTMTARTWQGLQRRSRKWHQGLRRAEIQRQWSRMMQQGQGEYRSWQSAIPEPITIDGLTLTPLTSEWDLYQESLELDHCVIHYGERCAQGSSRIFSITRGERHLATVELVHEHRGWMPIQVRGFRNQPVSDELRALARRAAEAYGRADRQEPEEKTE